jgi:hypothetical protein
MSVEPMVLIYIVLIVLIFSVRFLPVHAAQSAGLGDQDKDRVTLVRLYYTYWNADEIRKLIRLNAEQTQIQLPVADPVETPIDPDLYREQQTNTIWTAYKVYTTVNPFNRNVDPFQLDRTWHVVIDGDPPERKAA